ncbi:MAG TPA: RodZ domain-containing protein [Patescibacteria group bacterium]
MANVKAVYMVGFTTKKIDSLTLGERMKKIRNEHRLSIQDVSKSTKIQAKYLEYLEEGEYSKLPADVYVKGFLRSYAINMGLNEAALIKQFEREKGIHRNIKKTDEPTKSNKPIKSSGFVVTPKLIIVTSVMVVSLASFLYLYKEVDSFVSTPRLAILTPSDGATADGSSVHVAGVAEKDAMVSINDQAVLVNEKGEFSEDVGLKNGLNTIIVKARNRFNKQATQSISVNAHIAEAVDNNSQPVQIDPQQEQITNDGSATPFTIEVSVNPDPTWLSIEADGNLVYSGVLLPGSNQTFSAQQMVSVASGKGNETFVKVNGKDMGAVSSEPGSVRDIQFNASGKIKK